MYPCPDTLSCSRPQSSVPPDPRTGASMSQAFPLWCGLSQIFCYNNKKLNTRNRIFLSCKSSYKGINNVAWFTKQKNIYVKKKIQGEYTTKMLPVTLEWKVLIEFVCCRTVLYFLSTVQWICVTLGTRQGEKEITMYLICMHRSLWDAFISNSTFPNTRHFHSFPSPPQLTSLPLKNGLLYSWVCWPTLVIPALWGWRGGHRFKTCMSYVDDGAMNKKQKQKQWQQKSVKSQIFSIRLDSEAGDVAEAAECSPACMKPWVLSSAQHGTGLGGTCLKS